MPRCFTSRVLCPLMVTLSALVAVAWSASATDGPARGASTSTVVRFDDQRPGAQPQGFRALSSSRSEPGEWRVERDGRSLVLGQTAIGVEGYRLAVLDRVVLGDVQAGARLRVGRGDKAAGLSWRVQDAGNYYAARLDFDTREVVLYKFVHGTRVRLARATDVRLDPAAWHDLVAEHRGDRVRVWLNGVPVLSARDDSLSSPGSLGFWMPGDGTAQFERLWFMPLGSAQ